MILSDQDTHVVWAAMQANAQTIFTHGYDSDTSTEIEHTSFAELEEQIHSDLLSGDPQQAAAELRPLARRGWHLSRWLPTFLLIDGPLGRLLRDHQSPLAKILKTNS